MRASETTVIPTSRTRAGNDTARVDTRSDGFRKVVARTAPVASARIDVGTAPAIPADAEYFVHPFVD